MIICKNCKAEFEKGKFCPDCGFEVKEERKKSRGEEILEGINTRLSNIEIKVGLKQEEEKPKEKPEDNKPEDNKPEERKESDESTNTGRNESNGILDFF